MRTAVMLDVKDRQADHWTLELPNANHKVGKIAESELAEYSWDKNHNIQWDETEILHKEEISTMRKLKVVVSI
jgi:hypothetical protein